MSEQFKAPLFYQVREAIAHELQLERPELSRAELSAATTARMRAMLVEWMASLAD